MKFLLISSNNKLKPFLERSFSHQSAKVIHYDNPIKAMDNIEEISPDVIFFAAADYPRHWKPFIIYLRSIFSRRETVFILMITDSFSDEEAEKAEYLEVNAILDEDLTSRQTVERLGSIIARYHRTTDFRRFVRYIPASIDRIDFIYTNPYSSSIVTGRVLDISNGGLRFEPEDERETKGLDKSSIINSASLRIGDLILSVRVRALRIERSIGFSFYDLDLETENQIVEYLNGRSERELALVTSEESAEA